MDLANGTVLTKRKRIAVISLILCMFIPSYNYFLNEILQYDLGRGSISALSYIILAAVGLYGYSYLSKINKKAIVLMAIVLVALIISYMIYPEIRDAFISNDYNPLESILLSITLMGFPMMIYTNYLNKNIQFVFEYIRIPSLALVILAIIDYYWTVLVNGHYFEVNYMPFSYFMLPGVCFSFCYGISKGKIIDSIVAAIGLIVILVTGSRGCFVCGVAYFAFASFKRYSLSVGRMLLYLLSIIALVYVLSFFLLSFSDNMMSYLDEHGASSRTLMKMADGSFDESDSRNSIYTIMLNAVNDNPLGYGPMGDRYILYKHGNQGYAHSILYEFLVDYGIILGPILLIILMISVISKFKFFLKHEAYYVYAMFIALGLIKLFFSGSYLGEPFFWGLVGMLFIRNTIKKYD